MARKREREGMCGEREGEREKRVERTEPVRNDLLSFQPIG